MKELAEEFEGQFNCLGENTGKYVTFPVLMEKEVIRIDKKEKEIINTKSYRLQFIDSTRFMTSLLSNLVNNLAEGIHKCKCKYRHNDQKCETCSFLEYTNFKYNLIEYKCLCCNKNYQEKFDENLKKLFFKM